MSGGPAYSHPSAAGGGMGGANLMVGASTGMTQSGGMGERIKEAVEASIGDVSNLAKSKSRVRYYIAELTCRLFALENSKFFQFDLEVLSERGRQ